MKPPEDAGLRQRPMMIFLKRLHQRTRGRKQPIDRQQILFANRLPVQDLPGEVIEHQPAIVLKGVDRFPARPAALSGQCPGQIVMIKRDDRFYLIFLQQVDQTGIKCQSLHIDWPPPLRQHAGPRNRKAVSL